FALVVTVKILVLSAGPVDDTLIFQIVTNAKSIVEMGGTAIVFNEGQNDIDFRIEDTNETHAFMVRGSDGYVTFGGGAEPDEPFCINNLDNGTLVKIEEVVNDITMTYIAASIRCTYNHGGGLATGYLNLMTTPP
ncbi:unnamed protein product, partial [marine sediment metagenome]